MWNLILLYYTGNLVLLTRYLSFIGSHIIYITVGANIIPDPIQGIQIANKLQSSTSVLVRAAAAELTERYI